MPSKKKCINYDMCGSNANSSIRWCDSCYSEFTLRDKYYLIGFTDAWEITSYVGDKYFEAYEMGVADRLGVEEDVA